jgi:hypothetical protein
MTSVALRRPSSDQLPKSGHTPSFASSALALILAPLVQIIFKMSTPISYMRAIEHCRDDWRVECFRCYRRRLMLRISYAQTKTGQQWTLCGQLAGPWVQELSSFWHHTRKTGAETREVVDLSDVMFVDEQGERLLSEMRNAGVEFVAAGVETKHLIENLTHKGERPLRRLVGRLTNLANPCGEPRLPKNTNQER